jgi:hypothetical protein
MKKERKEKQTRDSGYRAGNSGDVLFGQCSSVVNEAVVEFYTSYKLNPILI